MANPQDEAAQAARSPHNDDPFTFSERASGEKISLETVCNWASVSCIVTRSIPLDIRIHGGNRDFIAARPGIRAYCLARKHMPNKKSLAGRYILERLAHGAYEWMSREILQADRRRRKRHAELEKRKASVTT